MIRSLFLTLALAVAAAAVAHGQAPSPPAPSPPAPTYPSITVTGTLAPGTYALVPVGDVKAWQDHAATIVRVRAMAQALLDATGPPAPAPPEPQPKPEPKPAPKPEPPPQPKPQPSPTPASVGKLWVVVVETPAGAPARGQLFSDPALTAYMKIKGNHFRIIDQNVRDASGKTPADVAPYLALAAGKTLPQAFVVDPGGHLLYSGTLPQTADALVALLKKVGG